MFQWRKRDFRKQWGLKMKNIDWGTLAGKTKKTAFRVLPPLFAFLFSPSDSPSPPLLCAHTLQCSHTDLCRASFSKRTQRAGSGFPPACRPPVPSVIHEPSARAIAVSDVCQTGPRLSPLFISWLRPRLACRSRD